MIQGIIYMFTNKINGKMYIGQTIDETRRIRRHLYAANHPDSTKNEGQPFVHALREFGFDNFDYAILERVSAENLNELRKILDEKECYYIELYDSINNGYNITRGGRGMLGYKLSEEAKVAISKRNQGRKLTESHKKTIGEAAKKMWENPEYRKYRSKIMSGENNPMYGIRLCGSLNHCYGKSMTEEQKRKISEAKKGKPGHSMSESHKEKLRKLMTGIPKTDEHKRKISEALIGRICEDKRKPVIQYTKKGIFVKEWQCICDAQTELNIVHISECANRKRNYAGGFIWRYKDDKGSIVSTPKNQRRIALIDDSDCILQEFNSIKEAAVVLGINYSNIGNVLQGYQKRTKGFRFKYI